jgi:hypothetical protein
MGKFMSVVEICVGLFFVIISIYTLFEVFSAFIQDGKAANFFALVIFGALLVFGFLFARSGWDALKK